MNDEPITPTTGLYEHFFGTSDLESSLRYWRQMGFDESCRGQLDAAAASALYGHRSALESVRLIHRSGASQGLVRVMAWQESAGDGLGFIQPLATGSRWSGFYTRDLLQIQDAYRDEAAATGERCEVSELARLFISDVTPSFYQPFMGIRESTVIGPHYRLAFLQRVGFDRPGFGTFAPDTVFPVTECTHGNIVLPVFEQHQFYGEALGLVVQTPVVRIDWHMEAVRHSLQLGEGEAFDVIVYQTPNIPTGFLRVYAPTNPTPDARALSCPGQLGNCGYSYRYRSDVIATLRQRVLAAGAGRVTDFQVNEFGETSFSCLAPDGIHWTFIADH